MTAIDDKEELLSKSAANIENNFTILGKHIITIMQSDFNLLNDITNQLTNPWVSLHPYIPKSGKGCLHQ